MYSFLDVGFVCQFLSLSFTNYRFSIVFFFTFLLFYPSAFFMIFFYSLSIQTFYYFLPLLFIASTLLFDSLPQNILLSFATTSCHNEFCDLVYHIFSYLYFLFGELTLVNSPIFISRNNQ